MEDVRAALDLPDFLVRADLLALGREIDLHDLTDLLLQEVRDPAARLVRLVFELDPHVVLGVLDDGFLGYLKTGF